MWRLLAVSLPGAQREAGGWAPHPERLSASDREQTRPGGDTLQTPACFSLGRDPIADGCLEHLGLCPQARRRMWTQDGPPCPRASARAGPSCHLEAPPHRSLPPPPPIPHRSSTNPPSTMGREQVAEIQDSKIQSKTGKVWGPSSEKGSWSEPGILGCCRSQNHSPGHLSSDALPQHRLSRRCPKQKWRAELVPLRCPSSSHQELASSARHPEE